MRDATFIQIIRGVYRNRLLRVEGSRIIGVEGTGEERERLLGRLAVSSLLGVIASENNKPVICLHTSHCLL